MSRAPSGEWCGSVPALDTAHIIILAIPSKLRVCGRVAEDLPRAPVSFARGGGEGVRVFAGDEVAISLKLTKARAA